MNTYPSPVDQFLTLGEIEWGSLSTEYVGRFGLSDEHIDALIAMATDCELHQADSETPLIWAPIHAWRALGQLRATSAVGPLLDVLARLEAVDDDFGHEDIPRVFAEIGPPALPQLQAYLNDASNPLYPRAAVANGLVKIAQGYPEARAECVAAMNDVLARAANNDPSLNGFIVGDLIDLKAVESESIVEAAYSAGYVDETIVGDWTEAQILLHGGVPASWQRMKQMDPRALGLEGFHASPPSGPLHYRVDARRARRKARDKRRKVAKARRRQ